MIRLGFVPLEGELWVVGPGVPGVGAWPVRAGHELYVETLARRGLPNGKATRWTMPQLLAPDREQLSRVWGSINREKLLYCLRPKRDDAEEHL